MRDIRKNKWINLYIGLYQEERPIYEKDEQGNIIYTDIEGIQTPIEIGTIPGGYKVIPVPIETNLAMSGGDAEALEYGVTTADYSARFTTTDKSLPITETSLMWEILPLLDENGMADSTTADWKVVKVSRSQEEVAYLLDKKNK